MATETRELTYGSVSALLNLRISDLSLYRRAFTHKSFQGACNERLEFIGDAVLNLVVSEYLFAKFPIEDEGFLTKARIRIVNGKTLGRMGLQMELDKYVRMNEKAMRSGWNANPRILEDLVESLIGAVYLDLGMGAAKRFVTERILNHLTHADIVEETNYKDTLIRWAKQGAQELDYQLVADQGTASTDRFVVRLVFRDQTLAEGRGATKKDAEQEAAYRAAQCLGLLDGR